MGNPIDIFPLSTRILIVWGGKWYSHEFIRMSIRTESSPIDPLQSIRLMAELVQTNNLPIFPKTHPEQKADIKSIEY